MGPPLIFDKSAIQSLNEDESLWLDNFYLVNITPLFYIETLADLEKKVHSGKTPEEVVGIIARKTPAMGCVNVHHQTLLYGELRGQGVIEMSGRPCIAGGKPVILEGETGIVFNESEEVEAFKRWQKYEFLDLERNLAKKWRRALASVNHENAYKAFQRFFSIYDKPKTFGDIRSQIELILANPCQKDILMLGLNLLGFTQIEQKNILERWEYYGKKPIKEFFPYFTHILSVDLFFYLGIASDLISRVRASHKVDFAYFYYLPFCSIFTSNDNLHKAVAPFFLRPDQIFITGDELKLDLSKLDDHYSKLPEDVKNKGVMSFAVRPPKDDIFLTTRIWDKYMSPKWREMKGRKFDGSDKIDPEMEKKMREKINKFDKDATEIDYTSIGNSDNAQHILVKHMVSAKKGKWRRVPPEVSNRRRNKDGEWEDIPTSKTN